MLFFAVVRRKERLVFWWSTDDPSLLADLGEMEFGSFQGALSSTPKKHTNEKVNRRSLLSFNPRFFPESAASSQDASAMHKPRRLKCRKRRCRCKGSSGKLFIEAHRHRKRSADRGAFPSRSDRGVRCLCRSTIRICWHLNPGRRRDVRCSLFTFDLDRGPQRLRDPRPQRLREHDRSTAQWRAD